MFEEYKFAIDEAFSHNTTLQLDKLLDGKDELNTIEVTKIMVDLEKRWQQYQKYNVQFGIIIDEKQEGNINDNIFTYDFEEDIKNIIQNGKAKTCIYFIDKFGKLITKEMRDEVSIEKLCSLSNDLSAVTFYLGINGIDVLIDGKVLLMKNHLDSYKDMINVDTLRSIHEYKKILGDFFKDKIQYDPYKQFFCEKTRLHSSLHHILDKHPKLLYSKPEQIFQRLLMDYLHNKCKDVVLDEARNADNERYDVWVLTEDRELYVFELKWLGKSVTADGKIFDDYNKEERAYDGAYQLKEYIDNAETYSYISKDERIYCGVLVIFDAREAMEDIVFEPIFNNYPQLDLTQHLKIEKEKIKASMVYKAIKKGLRAASLN